jgi:hypothetical protein
MAIAKVHSFLISPGKNTEKPLAISGTEIPRQGMLYDVLSALFDRASDECDIDIVFRHGADGEQQNDCRDSVMTYLQNPSTAHGRALGNRLQVATTKRSGLGLLFTMTGTYAGKDQIVMSRFPAEQGIVAEERERGLSVEFIERVFMKNAKAYKSVMYSTPSTTTGCWDGRAVDRQLTGPRELSEYWIHDFLMSELRTTGPAGTKRLAVAFRQAIRESTSPTQRHELISAATIVRGQDGQRRSARQVVRLLHLTQESTLAIERAFPRSELMDERFSFDRAEFQKHAPYRAVELDNGGMLVAEDERFAEVFKREDISTTEGTVRYVTEGRVIDEQLRKSK